MSPRVRLEPCDVLRQSGVPCLLWLEDAIFQYGVPTIGFDLFILVADPEVAANTLRDSGWIDIAPAEARSCNFLTQTSPITHRCLKPPGIKDLGDFDDDDLIGELPPPPSQDPPGPTITVLLRAQDCHVSIEPLSLRTMETGNFTPPLAVLMNGLISSVLDAPPSTELEWRLVIQLAYLYGHCKATQTAEFAAELEYENRQFHIDALTGPALVARLIAWNRQVRQELREGTRQLANENSLLSSEPSEFKVLIEQFRSDFRPLPQSGDP
jgi:hypothetical protein